MSIPNLLALAAFFAPRRIAKFFGFCGGRRRARQEPLVRCAGALAAACVTAVLVLLHLAAVKQVSR
jgi:hypothetical protein